jgi:hypothetical protein
MNRTKGFFVAFDYSSDALTEPPPAGCHGLLAIRALFRRSGKSIIALTVKEILDEEIAKKLA